MIRILRMTGLGLLAAVGVATAAVPAPTRLLQWPDIHGDTIVFCYEGDLWRTTTAGGEARRLTSYPGVESAPKISPDGTTVAFTGEYDGTPALYSMPIEGGAPTRLTWMGLNARPVAWTPDGAEVVFRSSHENTFRPVPRLYAVPQAGGWARRLPVERGILCSFSPDGRHMVYNRRGLEDYYWKRYKGGQYTDIWQYDFDTKAFTPLTDYVGKNAYPMWVGGSVYFVSDRGANGIANLYALDPATKAATAVTQYAGLDVQMPSSDGGRVVFVQAGTLHVYDPATRAVTDVPVVAPSDGWSRRERTVNPQEWIQWMGAANDGQAAVFEARGDILLVPADPNQPTRNLTDSPGVRERYPQLSPDGTRVAYFSDRSGEYQVYVQDVAGDAPPVQLTTTLDRTIYHLEWSPDGTQLLFGDKDYSLFTLNVATKALKRFVTSRILKNDEFFWEISDYGWSPDSKWVVYSLPQANKNNQVFLYSLERDRIYPVTDGFYDSMNPCFDADGRYLYFLSYRNFKARIDIFEDNHVIPDPVKVMVVALEAGQRPPFDRRPLPDGAQEERPDRVPAPARPFRIDLEGLATRLYEAPVPPGNYFYLKAGRGLLSYVARETIAEDEIDRIFTPTTDEDLSLHLFSMTDQKEVTLEEPVNDWRLSPNHEQAVVRRDGQFHLVRLQRAYDRKALGPALDLSRMSARVNPRQEWTQIFNDAWRWYRDFFYDPDMHGRDWGAIGDKFRAFLPDLTSRADLNWLLSEMVGELCVSHTYVRGGDMGLGAAPASRVYPGLLGADLEPDAHGYFRFTRIYGPTAIESDLKGPLARPDVDIHPGDYLLAVDGHDVQAPDTPWRYLQVIAGQKVRLTVNSTPTRAGARQYDVEPLRSESTLRYNRWVADNLEQVRQATHDQVGYLHISSMSTDNTGQFDKFWRAFRYKKGLIIDVRGNSGGWTEYFLIDKLERRMVGYNVLRNMEPFRYPGSVSNGPLVALTNEYNGSDGEAFLKHFMALKLGTVIGVPSWGGLVGIINGQNTIDGGRVEQSNNSFYGREGTWWVENHGVDPDIRVDNDPASATAGHDAQLEKAIAVVLEKIAAAPDTFPAHPPYPRK